MEQEITIPGEELHRRFLNGDNDAFEELVALYEYELYLFVNSIVNDYHEAKHLMIEAFALLALNGSRFAGKSSLKTYLFTIAKNLSLKYLKIRNKEQHIPYEEVLETFIDEGETPESFIEREENKQYLSDSMRNLKEDYRIVLQLLYFEDASYAEAGRLMGKSVKQISDMAYRAKAALKKELENSGFSRF
jgi:RNA polymerase sigma-70 factor (ECF subfamily)